MKKYKVMDCGQSFWVIEYKYNAESDWVLYRKNFLTRKAAREEAKTFEFYGIQRVRKAIIITNKELGRF
jgi:hypothetical protein